MDFLGIQIESIVPHRGRMLMVDRLLAGDSEGTVVSALIRPDNLFADEIGVPAWVGIEYMAQAIAAWAGIQALIRGEPTRIGFLLGSRRYLAHVGHFGFGDRLTIEARRELFGDNGLGMFSCRIALGDRELANAQVSVFEPPDPGVFFEGNANG